MITCPTNKIGQITKQTTVIYQQKNNDPATPKVTRVNDSTWGGMESVATPLILEVSFYNTPESTEVAFSEWSKKPIFFVMTLT